MRHPPIRSALPARSPTGQRAASLTPFHSVRRRTRVHLQLSHDFKFEGKQRDNYTSNDFFGARYYSNRWGRWLSADWSNVPAPVPYANLSNPQTLNLYSMVADDPESFADLDGHTCQSVEQSLEGPLGGQDRCPMETAQKNAEANNNNAANNQAQNQNQQLLVSPDKKADVKYGDNTLEQNVDYNLVQTDSKGNTSPADKPSEHKVELKEKLLTGDPKKVTICTGQCVTQGTLTDTMSVTAGKGHSVEKRFLVDGSATKIYDPGTKKA